MKAMTMAMCAALFAQLATGAEAVRDSGTTFVKDALSKYVESGELPGAISVLYDNGRQEVACVGYADAEKKRPITLDDHFMQCSQTKGFCGVMVAKLVEEGRISLDDPVSKYLPEYKGAGFLILPRDAEGKMLCLAVTNAITVRMCLNHTAGFPFELPGYVQMGGWSRRMPLRSVAATAISQRLLFEPGTRAQYSNVGIDVAGAVVEVVTGMRFEEYLKKTLLDPLGMTETTFYPSEKQLEGKIELYKVKGGQKAKWVKDLPSMQRPYGDDRVFASCGAGLWTTVRDQLKFYKMLMNLGVGDNGARILKEETVKGLLAVSSRPAGLGGYSLGLSAPEKDGEDKWFGHGGAWGTECNVNWHRRQLKMWVIQETGEPRPWVKDWRKCADTFFKAKNGGDAGEYTGRMN